MIFKFQQGGELIPPLVSYTPVTVSGGPQAASAGTSETKSQDLTDKDMLTMLKDLNGLPSDMQAIQQSLQNFYIDESTGFNTSNITTKYLQILTSMKTANFNKQQYDEAFNIVKANGGLNEIAINDRGQVFCMNNQGDFQLLSPEEIKGSGYAPLTNSELLQYRAHSPEMAYKNNILKVVSNGIGMEAVTKMLQEAITNIGTTSESNEGFASTQASQLINGLEDFIKAQQKSGNYDATIDNLYKGKFLTKNQAMQAKAAINYIYTTLPANVKTLLKTKTPNGTDLEVVQLMETLISSKLNSTTNFSLSLTDPDGDGKSSTSGSKDSDVNTDLVSSIQAGYGGHDTIYQLNNRSNIGMTIGGTAYEQIKDTEGNHIGRTSVENLLNQSGLRSIINADNGIFFGDQKIDLDALLNIAYDGKGLLRVNLPIQSNGSPNFKLLEEYSKAYSEFLLSSQTDQDRLEIFGDREKYPNLTSLIKPSGEFDISKFAPFIVVSGVTTDNLINIDKENNKFITEVDQTPDIVKQLKTSLSIGSGKATQYPDIDEYDFGEWISLGLNKYDHVFKGNIYIPLNMNKFSAALGGNQNIKTNRAQMLENEYQNRDINFTKLDPSILINNN